MNRTTSECYRSPKGIKSDTDDGFEIEAHVAKPAMIAESTFVPLYLMYIWQGIGTNTKRITLAISLPSGVGAGAFRF